MNVKIVIFVQRIANAITYQGVMSATVPLAMHMKAILVRVSSNRQAKTK